MVIENKFTPEEHFEKPSNQKNRVRRVTGVDDVEPFSKKNAPHKDELKKQGSAVLRHETECP